MIPPPFPAFPPGTVLRISTDWRWGEVKVQLPDGSEYVTMRLPGTALNALRAGHLDTASVVASVYGYSDALSLLLGRLGFVTTLEHLT